MNQTTWKTLGVIAIIALGAVLLNKNDKATDSAMQDTPKTPTVTTTITTSVTPIATMTDETTLVTYSDSGFSPKQLTVKAGETVTFTNQATAGMWVASAPHPSHTAYPEFDAKKEIAAGESYTFTFTKVGSWKYHNHLNPSDFGTIVVQ